MNSTELIKEALESYHNYEDGKFEKKSYLNGYYDARLKVSQMQLPVKPANVGQEEKFILMLDDKVLEIRDEDPPDVWYRTHWHTTVMTLTSFRKKYNKEPFVGLTLRWMSGFPNPARSNSYQCDCRTKSK